MIGFVSTVFVLCQVVYGHPAESNIKILVAKVKDEKPSYHYEYGIMSDDTGDFKGLKEVREGDVTKGEYHVNDPDGFVRVVMYTVDKHKGFQAKVTRTKGNHLVVTGYDNNPERKIRWRKPPIVLKEVPIPVAVPIKVPVIQEHEPMAIMTATVPIKTIRDYQAKDSQLIAYQKSIPDIPRMKDLLTGEKFITADEVNNMIYEIKEDLTSKKMVPLYNLKDVNPRRFHKKRHNKKKYVAEELGDDNDEEKKEFRIEVY